MIRVTNPLGRVSAIEHTSLISKIKNKKIKKNNNNKENKKNEKKKKKIWDLLILKL